MNKLLKLAVVLLGLLPFDASALPFNKSAPLNGLVGFPYQQDFAHQKFIGPDIAYSSNPSWGTMASQSNAGNPSNAYYVQWKDGILRPSGSALGFISRCSDYGCWEEAAPAGSPTGVGSATNYLLQSRSFNNAAFTATNATVTKTSIIGADNISGNGNQITFTANNGTVKQAIAFAGKLDAVNVSSIVVGGTGYVTNDKVTFNATGGTCGTAPIGIVTASGGVVSSIAFTGTGSNRGSCTGLPISPLTQASTTGIGVGLTITPFWTSGTPSVWAKCVTCTGAIYIDGSNCVASNNISSKLLTTQYLQVRAPTVPLVNNTYCIQGANSGDVIDVDFGQFETDDQATSPIVTTTTALGRGPELQYIGISGVTPNKGLHILTELTSATPVSMVFEYSGNFSTTLNHFIWGTDGTMSVSGHVGSSTVSFIFAGGGGTSVVSTNSDVSGLYLTAPGNTGSVNKVAVSANGTTLMICLNGVVTTGAGHFQATDVVSHGAWLNNGSNLVPSNGYVVISAMAPGEMTAGQCIEASKVTNNM